MGPRAQLGQAMEGMAPMLLEPWIRVLMLAGMWTFLALVLAVGLSRWWRAQRLMDQRATLRRMMEEGQTSEEDLMRLIEAWTKDL